MGKKVEGYISLFVECVALGCAILSLTDFKLDVHTFFNSLDAVGKIYLFLIVGSMLVVHSFFYSKVKFKRLENNLFKLNSNLKINVTKLETRFKENISNLECNLKKNISELEHNIIELKEKIIRIETIVENLKDEERNVINKLIEKLL